MTNPSTSFRLSEPTLCQLQWLADRFGNKTTAVTIAIDRMYQAERRDMQWNRDLIVDELGADNWAEVVAEFDGMDADAIEEWLDDIYPGEQGTHATFARVLVEAVAEKDVGEQLHLVYPTVVPIRALTWLAKAGVHTTEEAHEHIRNGTLESLPGIGSRRAERITMWYTDAADWPAVRRKYNN